MLMLLTVAGTLALILVRPRGLSEAWSATAGALVMLALSPLELGDLPGVLDETGDVLLFLLGMMLLTHLVEEAGVFARLAEECARFSRGSGRLLFCLVFGLGALITALLSLDVTVIVLTPIVYTIALRRRLDPVPFLFACTFVANTASLVLPVSNLTNLLVYHDLRIPFGTFAATMWLPNLAAALVNLVLFLRVFRARIPPRFQLVSDDPLPPVTWWFRVAAIVLTATLIALIASGLLGYPLAPAALGGGTLLLVTGLFGQKTALDRVIRGISWPVFVFVIGMFIVVRGVQIGVIDHWQLPIPDDPGSALLLGAGVSALGSNIVNNVPMTLLMMSIFPRVSGTVQQALAYGTLVGSNIGPTLTTYGSLATMLWLTSLRKRGVQVSVRAYLTIGFLTMPPVLLAATAALWLTIAR